MDISEECEKMWSSKLRSCHPKGSQALMELLDPILRLSLLCRRPAAQDRTYRLPERKTLFLREADGSFGAFLGSTHLATELMEHSRRNQGIAQAEGVHNLLRQGQCLVD